MDEDVWPKLKFINEKNIKRLKENLHNDFTFLGEDFVVRINIIILSLFAQHIFPIPLVLWFNWHAHEFKRVFPLILSYLVSDRRKPLLSEHKLENLFFLICLIQYLGATGKFSGQKTFGIHLQHTKERLSIW